MAKLVVVKADRVEGVDTHKVKGLAAVPAPPSPVPYEGVGRFEYHGKLTDALSNFVTINDIPIASKASQSTLNPGEAVMPAGKHSGPQGSNFVPPSVPGTLEIQVNTLQITDTIGVGKPSVGAGSAFVTVDGVAVLLDGDAMDSCDATSAVGNSTVIADGQDFVFCAE